MSYYTRLAAAIERREQIARACLDEAPGHWEANHLGSDADHEEFVIVAYDEDAGPVSDIMITGSRVDAEHIALHDPADARRRYAHYRRILTRHVIAYRDSSDAAWERNARCERCYRAWPCDPICDLAEALGVQP